MKKLRTLLRAVRTHWSKISFSLRIAAVSWVALIGLVSALQFFGLVPDLPKLDAAAWTISLVIIAVDNVGSMITRHRRTVDAERDRNLEKALMALLIQIARADSRIRFEDLGANVFEFDGEGLRRVYRFRPAGPQQSGIDWTPTKGVVGACATGKRAVYFNSHAIARRHRGDTDATTFAKIPEKTKYGFNLQEFNAIAPKYSEIRAEPIWHSGQDRTMIGVLTIDRAYREDGDGATVHLSDRRAAESAEASASMVAEILRPRVATAN